MNSSPQVITSESHASSLAAPSLGWPSILACVLGTLLMHGSVLTARYGSTDDFWLYFQSWQPDEPRYPATIYLSAGRPLTAWAWTTVRPSIASTADLIPLRFMSLLGLMALALTVVDACRAVVRRESHRVFLAVAILALPVCTTFAAWATVWLYPWSAVAALLSARIIGEGIVPLNPMGSATIGYRIARGALSLVVAAAFALISLAIYQPTFGWFWLAPLAMAWTGWFQTSRRASIRFWVQCGFGIIALAVAFASQKLIPAVAGVAAQDRSNLALNPFEKLEAVIRVQLPIVSNGWVVVDSTRKWQVAILGGVVLLTTLVLIAHAARGRGTKAAFRGLTQVTIALAFCHVHWWAVAYTAKNYRTTGALSASLMVTFVVALAVVVELLGKADRKRWQRTFAIGCGTLTLIALVMGTFNTWYYWVSPLSRSLAFLRDELVEQLEPGTREIHVIRQRQYEGLVPGQPIYEHGQPLTDFEWAIDGVVIAALGDAGRDLGSIQVTHSRPSRPSIDPPPGVSADIPTPAAEDSGVILIDMRQLAAKP